MTPSSSLLLITPILPAETGNGLAMRAGVFLDALARDHTVTLLVIPLAGQTNAITPFVEKRTRRVVILDIGANLDPLWSLCERLIDPDERANALANYPRPALCRFATTPSLRAAQNALAGETFQAVHVLRSYLAAYAEPFLQKASSLGSSFASIDLDDDEALTHQRIAMLCEGKGLMREARIAAAEAEKYARYEAAWLPRFDLIITCDAAHRDKTAVQYPHSRTSIVPNTVAMQETIFHRRPHFGKHILFVGNLSYLPNVDGICYFVMEILPLLRIRTHARITLRMAGSSPTAEIRELATHPGVELVTNPPEMTRHYRWADLAVIPIRAGGGTRIKMLEAFAHGVPVVASRVGAEGISVTDRHHLLLADDPQAFAKGCIEILSNPRMANELSKHARNQIMERYVHSIAIKSIRDAIVPSASNANK